MFSRGMLWIMCKSLWQTATLQISVFLQNHAQIRDIFLMLTKSRSRGNTSFKKMRLFIVNVADPSHDHFGVIVAFEIGLSPIPKGDSSRVCKNLLNSCFLWFPIDLGFKMWNRCENPRWCWRRCRPIRSQRICLRPIRLENASHMSTCVATKVAQGRSLLIFPHVEQQTDLWISLLKTWVEGVNIMTNKRKSDDDSEPITGRKYAKVRTYANERERGRTQSVNGAFQHLRELIPTEPVDRKLSKIETLRLATSYIEHLTTQLNTGEISVHSTSILIKRKLNV